MAHRHAGSRDTDTQIRTFYGAIKQQALHRTPYGEISIILDALTLSVHTQGVFSVFLFTYFGFIDKTTPVIKTFGRLCKSM